MPEQHDDIRERQAKAAQEAQNKDPSCDKEPDSKHFTKCKIAKDPFYASWNINWREWFFWIAFIILFIWLTPGYWGNNGM